MTDFTASASPDRQAVDAIRAGYLALVRRRRLYGGVTLLVFVVLMASGFQVANERNAGDFLQGIGNVGDYPRSVIVEAWEERAELPGLIAEAFPALVETINIAAVSTLLGVIAGFFLAMHGTRGLALLPRAIPLVRRVTDVMRAIPEIVIALVLIFVLRGGPVPAVIAIAIHTAGAMGKLFSEVAENADLKPVVGLGSVGVSPRRVSIETGSGRVAITRSKTEVFRYFRGWELFFFTLDSPFSGAGLGRILFGERIDPARPNIAGAWEDFVENPMWRHGEVA